MFLHLCVRLVSRDISVQEGVSVWGRGCLCPEGSLSRRGVSVQGDLCQGDPLYGNMRAVRILLECILVSLCVHLTVVIYPSR